MLVVGASLVGWGCGGDDTSPASQETPGAGGAAAGVGGAATGGAGQNTGGFPSGVGGLGAGTGLGGTGAGANAGVGGAIVAAGGAASGGAGSDMAGGAGGGILGGGTGGVTVGTGGVAASAGGTDAASGGTGGAQGGAGDAAGGMAGSLGGSGGSADAMGGSTEGGSGDGTGGAAGGTNSSSGGAGGNSGGGGGDTGGSASTSSPGCGTPISRPAPNVQQTMDVDGATRYYLLHVPPEADNQTPLMLIFGLHGYDMNNVAVAGLYDFTQRSNGQAITVLPYGEGPPPGDVSHWGDHVLESTWQANPANYNFIERLISDLQSRFCIDTRRVFIAGFSMGGFFTNTLACDHSDWFRGFAPIAGGGPMNCANGATPAIMLHHGTADDIVDISSGEGSRDFWVEHNECASTSTSSYTGCESYDGCPERGPVVWCVGNFNHTINSTTAANIWSFFSGLE